MPPSSHTAPALSVNVSLEDHLLSVLRPLPALLPPPLAAQLAHVLADCPDSPSSSTASPATASPKKTIPYALLTAISKWSRDSSGQTALTNHNPPLPLHDYTIIALLAGTQSSPDKLFPHIPPSSSPHAARARELADRRAVTALLNALLSIFGAAIATYWAADRLAWRNEWKVLLALSVAILIASSEAALYLIWQSKSSSIPPPLRLRRTPTASQSETRRSDKKHDSSDSHIPPQDTPDVDNQSSAVISVTSARPSTNSLRERLAANARPADHTSAGQDQ